MRDHRMQVRRNVGRGVQGYRGPNRVNFLLRYPWPRRKSRVAELPGYSGALPRLQRE
jgi:hypothetical protein